MADNDVIFLSLKRKMCPAATTSWVGSRESLAQVDLWSDLWCLWQLLGDSVSVQWVPSHVRIKGNERADEGAAKGSTQAFQTVLGDREGRDIWHHFGLEEMSDESPCDSEAESAPSDNRMGGSLEGADLR